MDKDYYENKKYNKKDLEKLHKDWFVLYDDYFVKSGNQKYRQELKNKDETLKLLLKIDTMDKLIELLKHLYDNKDYVPNEAYLKTVTNLSNNLKRIDKNVKFDITKPFAYQLDVLEAIKGGLKTRYQLLFKEEDEEEKKDIMLYYNIKSYIEQVLNRNLKDDMNMLEWLSYENLYKQKLKHGKQ